MGSLPDLPAMKTEPKFIFFTDFDGTITLQDSNDLMVGHIPLQHVLGFGPALRKQGNKDVLEGRKTFRHSFKEMMDSISTPYNACIDFLVSHIELDPQFPSFLRFARAHNIPVVVLSGGMEPIISALLRHLVGPENAAALQIVSNGVRVRDGFGELDEQGGWELVFRDESGFGHDKARTIRPYAELAAPGRPTLFYAGDGVSDLSAARETDLLFARRGRDLVSYCVREDVPFTVFDNWGDITDKLADIVGGKTTVKEAAAEGYADYKASAATPSRLGDKLGVGADEKKSGHTTPLVLEAGGGSKP